MQIDEGLDYCNVSEIKVNKKYQNMLPRPDKKEYEQIKNSIDKEGQEKPVTVNEKMILIDGHTRLQICKELKINIYYEKKTFADKMAVLQYMAILNLHRRNLTQYQKVLLYKELYLAERKKAKLRQIEGSVKGGLRSHGKKQEKIVMDKGKSLQKYAKIIGVTPDAVHKTLFIEKYASEKIKEKVKEGKITVTNAFWKSKEKMQKIKTKKTIKLYTYKITIQPSEGSIWRWERKWSSNQADRIKTIIKSFNPTTKDRRYN